MGKVPINFGNTCKTNRLHDFFTACSPFSPVVNMHNFNSRFLCASSNYTNFKKVLDFSRPPAYSEAVIEETKATEEKSYGNTKIISNMGLKTVSGLKMR